MLMLITGNVREGKTLLAVYLAWVLHNQNISLIPYDLLGHLPIYTNFKLSYPEARFVDVGDLLDLEGIRSGLMVMDEAYAWLESRVSSSSLNRYVSYFIFQSGKRGVDVVATAQLGSSIDLRFYDLAHIIVLARKDVVKSQFVYQFAVRCGVSVRVVTKTLSFVSAKLFWDDYDTGAPVAPLGLKALQVEMDKFSPVKINVRVDGLVEKALAVSGLFGWKSERDVFRYQVEDWLLRIGEPLPLAPLVTNRLKCSLRK